MIKKFQENEQIKREEKEAKIAMIKKQLAESESETHKLTWAEKN